VDVIHEHYNQPLPKEAGEVFFSLTPEDLKTGKILPLSFKAVLK